MHCRLCNTELEHVFVDLGSSPAANSFLTKEQLNEPEVWYPLKVMVCHECFLVQMDEYKPAEEIFNEDYPYYSSHSPNNVSRAKDYVEMMMGRFNPESVLEIGSNDGYLLQWFKYERCEVLGFDPAEGAAKIAIAKGIPTLTDFFSADGLTRPYLKGIGQFDLVCGSNVLAHQTDLNDFLKGVRIVLNDDGVCTFEFPTVVNLLNGSCQFDTIYQEHFHYLSFTVVCDLFKRHQMEVFDVLHTPEQGGSIMVFAQHKDSRPMFASPGATSEGRVGTLLNFEKNFGITRIERYQDFQKRVENTKDNLIFMLTRLKREGSMVIAYGASCKCNTLLNYCGIRPDLIKYVVDKSPLKQGKYLPGSHLPICSEEVIKRDRPDYVLITAWNLKDEIMEQLSYIREWGGHFIMTTPFLEVL
jgi:SAM-dependent methyltransferase